MKQKFVVIFGLVALTSLVFAIPKPVYADATIVVNSTADDEDDDGECTLREAIIASNTNTASGITAGECVAGDSGHDTITFNISGTPDFTNNSQDGYTIKPQSVLPEITEQVTIDGYSQPGATPNTAIAPQPLNGTLLVEVDGGEMSFPGSILQFSNDSDNSTVKGLVINNNGANGDGIGILADDVHVQGNYIGTDPTGTSAKPNTVGVNAYVQDAASGQDALIGGLNAADRNLISGNTAGTTGTASYPGAGWIFQGNYMGVAADGLTPIANSTNGGSGTLSIDEVSDTVVGGPESTAINVIGASLGHGIAPHEATNLQIEGNYIGLGYDGTTVLGNSSGGDDGAGIALSSSDQVIIKNNRIAGWVGDGVAVNGDNGEVSVTDNLVHDNGNVGISAQSGHVEILRNTVHDNGGSGISLYAIDGAEVQSNNVYSNLGNGIGIEDSEAIMIGGTSPAEANQIHDNQGAGIITTDPSMMVTASFLGNAIYDNQYLGIDLESDGTTNNDALDADSGANDLLNFPEYTKVEESGGNTTVNYRLDVPAGDYRIEFFSNTTADSSGHGEGETFLDSQNVTSLGAGAQTFSYTLTGVTGVTHLAMTTTEIDASTPSGFGATSEFGGEGLAITDMAATKTLINPQDIAVGVRANYQIVITNHGPDDADLSGMASPGASQPVFFDFVPPDLINPSGYVTDGPFPGSWIIDVGNPDLTCLYGPAPTAASLVNTSDTTLGVVACWITGADPTLESGASLTANLSFEVAPDSDLVFTNYVLVSPLLGDPDWPTVSDAFTSSDAVAYLKAHPVNNFAASVYPVPTTPEDSTADPATNTEDVTLADTGSNLGLLALAGFASLGLSVYYLRRFLSARTQLLRL